MRPFRILFVPATEAWRGTFAEADRGPPAHPHRCASLIPSRLPPVRPELQLLQGAHRRQRRHLAVPQPVLHGGQQRQAAQAAAAATARAASPGADSPRCRCAPCGGHAAQALQQLCGGGVAQGAAGDREGGEVRHGANGGGGGGRQVAAVAEVQLQLLRVGREGVEVRGRWRCGWVCGVFGMLCVLASGR